MGYTLQARNKDAGSFDFGAFSFPVLLEACGYLFPAIQGGGRWYQVGGMDERFASDYPGIISNDGFSVTAEEARIMARIARNFAAIQRSLPEEHRGGGLTTSEKGREGITRDDLIAALQGAMSGQRGPEPWPLKIRDDFTEKFERFAEWADRSSGFRIW